MKRFISHILCTAAALVIPKMASAQYYSVNLDFKTAAAMVAAYGTGTAAELYYDEQIEEILKHYKSAETSTAGIFSSKYLDRKALTDLGIWASPTENYYYRRIYNMVASHIMPKIWTVGGMMLKSPQNALYWGSYLMKVCDETKNLCMQFESVVTNSTLSFGDIAFLEIRSEIADVLRLSELGGVDFEGVLDRFADVGDNFTKENLKEDLDKLVQKAATLATTGAANLLQTSNFNDLFNGKLTAAIDIAENYASLFESFENNVGGTIVGLVGGEDAVANLFEIGDYNLTSWINDYARESQGQYYTQRWYIYRKDTGSEVLCNYVPPTDNNSILNGSHWYRINTSDQSFYPDYSQREAILQNSEKHAGWSRSRVNQLNAANDGSTYTFSSSLQSYQITGTFGKLKKKAYAYNIRVTRNWNNSEVVYEDVFDSYSMNLDVFTTQMNIKLAALNDNEDGYTYYIGTDAKNYYSTTDARKLEGIETVTISVTSDTGATLGEGSTQYKCSGCGTSLSAHAKECSMKTSVVDSGVDTGDLEAMSTNIRSKIEVLNAQIALLEQENAELIKQIREADIEEAASLRLRYNANRDKIDSLKAEVKDYQSQLDDVNAAIKEAEQGEDVPTDDYYRIPAIMQSLQSTYHLTWQDAGSWSGYTFIRHATIPNIRGTVTFRAKLSLARKAKYFLGIRILRAIVKIDWTLSADFSDTQVVDILTLDPNMDAQQKADIVNKRIAEIAKQYPGSTVSVDYARSEPVQQDETEDMYHLLWSSDRLEIAREVDTRLTRIYADLVSLEKMMSYKRDILDVLKDIASNIDDDKGRKLSIIEQCHKRWITNASLMGNDNNNELRP